MGERALAATNDGRAIRGQQALGGAGGAGGVAGRGGDAVSTLEIDDLAAASRSRHLDAFLLALAGDGGDATEGGTAGKGGDASASLFQRALEQTFLVQAGGGNGGSGDTGGGPGGDASVAFRGEGGLIDVASIDNVVAANGEADGGDGGDATGRGDGGDGGQTVATAEAEAVGSRVGAVAKGIGG